MRARFVAVLWGCCLLSWTVHAQPIPGLGAQALPAHERVPLATRQAPQFGVVGRLQYGFTEAVLPEGDDRHHRAGLQLGGSLRLWRELSLALRVDTRVDTHRAPADSGFAVSPELGLRYRYQLGDLGLALDAALRLPASDPGRALRAVTPRVGLAGTWSVGSALQLSALVGARFDRSERSVEDVEQLTGPDQIAAGLSEHNQLLLGAAALAPLGDFEGFVEWSWDWAIGAGAPSPGQSPMRVEAGLRRLWGPLEWTGRAGVSPSSRPAVGEGRIEPRFWLAISVGAALGGEQAPVPEQVQAPAAPAPRGSLRLRVRAPDESPLPDAKVTLRHAEGEQTARSDGEGWVTFQDVPPGPAQLSVEKDGFDRQTHKLDVQPGDNAHPDLGLERSLPVGQLRGQVRSLRGRSLRATVRIEPLGKEFRTGADGHFEIDVAPGNYTVEVEAPGHAPQSRAAQVELNGVTILVIDLRKRP